MTLARRHVRLLFALLLIVAAVIFWISIDNKQQQTVTLSVTPQSDIDFFIVDAAFKAFDLEGNLAQTATANKVQHYKQKQHSVLVKPVIYSFEKQQPATNISSNTATVYDKTGIVTFEQSVEVIGFKNHSADTFLKTQELNYNRNENSLFTDEDVEFTDIFGSITTATGLFVDLKLRTMDLKSNVKGAINVK